MTYPYDQRNGLEIRIDSRGIGWVAVLFTTHATIPIATGEERVHPTSPILFELDDRVLRFLIRLVYRLNQEQILLSEPHVERWVPDRHTKPKVSRENWLPYPIIDVAKLEQM